MGKLKFTGALTGNSLILEREKLVCIPAKESYNEVSLSFENPFKDGLSIQVINIDNSWLDYENKIKLGKEIENRWLLAAEAQNTEITFNSALNFALDEIDSDDNRILFLRLWREGDWDSIQAEFPEFDLNTIGQKRLQIA